MTALDLAAACVLDDGARWGDAATPEQWADMRALLDDSGPRRHFWLRSRGRSKTFDISAAAIALMLTEFGGGDEAYCAAAGRDQAALIMRKVRGIAERTPELGCALDCQQYRVSASRSGAVLDVIAADLATSWGRTPRWLSVDEIANHGRTELAEGFVNSLLTSLPKRPDSRCVVASTPSSPSHWAFGLWRTALDDPLWRASLTSGPAPWQSVAELESERRRLPQSLWRRLFECEWAEADDALADAGAVEACIRHEDVLEPESGLTYVVSFDLSVSSDHTAAAVCHLRDEDGGRVVVVDRLRAWVPGRGRHVDLQGVEGWIDQAARDYNGALVIGDPYQAELMISRLRDRGHRVKPVTFSAASNSRRAQQLLRLIRDRTLDLPADGQLRQELLSLRLSEGSTPGVVRLTTDGGSAGHFDRVTAVMLGAEELLSRPLSSYATIYGPLVECKCGWKFPEGSSCAQCAHRLRSSLSMLGAGRIRRW